jgi:magnesium transporter
MLEIFKTYEGKSELVTIEDFEKGCWVNLVNPSEDELRKVQDKLGIHPSFLRDPLDEEEKPRLDIEEDQTLIIVDIPYVYEEGNDVRFATIPMGLVVLEDYIVTVSIEKNAIIESFRSNKIRGLYTYKKTRFTFQMLFVIAKDFLRYLRYIDKKTDDVEKQLHKSMKNKELFKLLDLAKSLVYFTTSLKSNETVLEKLLRGRYLKMYEEDQDLLEDVIIENKQALEMANIHSSILSGMMDAFASVISNNLNIVMKFLTSVTIVMAIPTMVSSLFGMNVALPMQNNPLAFLYIVLISLGVSAGAVYYLYKKQMF